jgi:hypothetical protein
MSPTEAGNEAVWRCLLGQPVERPLSLRSPLPALLARRSSRGLIEALLAPLEVKLEGGANDFLLSRLAYAAQLKTYRTLAAAGLAPVALKGFANAHRLYSDPLPRIVGDLDLLIDRRHLKAAIETLAPEGFRFAPIRTKKWGLIGDASFAPFHSADGVCNVDLHVAPDSWPLTLGLGARRVIDEAIETGGIRMPRDEHALLIAVSNAAKDKFGWRTFGKALDLARLLAQRGKSMDWDEIQRLARAARLERAMVCFFGLLRQLGAEVPALPPPRGVLFEGLLAEWKSGFATEPGGFTVLGREARLAHAPATALALNFKRVVGLLSPNDGVPAEGRAYT